MNAILKYPGGKWRISKWIISHFPEHKVYVEPYFGSGAVFFNKMPSYIETINDVDGNIVNLFKVCRESPHKLAQLIEFTPFSREEFEECFEIAVADPVERARRTLVRFHQSFGTTNSKKRVGEIFRLMAVLDVQQCGTAFPEEYLRFADVLRKPKLKTSMQLNLSTDITMKTPLYTVTHRICRVYEKEICMPMK